MEVVVLTNRARTHSYSTQRRLKRAMLLVTPQPCRHTVVPGCHGECPVAEPELEAGFLRKQASLSKARAKGESERCLASKHLHQCLAVKKETRCLLSLSALCPLRKQILAAVSLDCKGTVPLTKPIVVVVVILMLLFQDQSQTEADSNVLGCLLTLLKTQTQE